MLTRLVSVSILSILTTVTMLSTMSLMDKDTTRRDLDLTVPSGQRAELDAVRRDFPGLPDRG